MAVKRDIKRVEEKRQESRTSISLVQAGAMLKGKLDETLQATRRTARKKSSHPTACSSICTSNANHCPEEQSEVDPIRKLVPCAMGHASTRFKEIDVIMQPQACVSVSRSHSKNRSLNSVFSRRRTHQDIEGRIDRGEEITSSSCLNRVKSYLHDFCGSSCKGEFTTLSNYRNHPGPFHMPAE